MMRALVCSIVLLGVTSHFTVSSLFAADCSTTDLNDTAQVTIGDLDWTVHYDEGSVNCGAIVDAVSATAIDTVIEVLQFSFSRHQTAWNFEQPWFTTLSDANLKIDIDVQDSGIYDGGGNCTALNSLKVRCSQDQVERILPHELFHAIQYRYGSVASQASGFSLFGWVFEGSARCLDDRYFAEKDPANTFHGDASGWLTKNKSLFDVAYEACLPFSYFCERLGSLQFEPDRGVDFLRQYWQKVTDIANDTDVFDFVAALDEAISDAGGGSLNKMWLDFAVACYTREFDVSALDDPDRFRFVDEVVGPGPIQLYSDLKRTEVFNMPALPQTRNGDVPEYAIRLYELFPPLVSTCEAVGFSGESPEDIGWALIGVRPGADPGDPEWVSTVTKSRGRDFTGTVLSNVFNEYSRVALIVTGLDVGADFEIKLGAGIFTTTIVRPTSEKPEHAGPALDPNPILVRLLILGPEELTPEGIGQRSVKGLTSEDFVVTIGADVATVVASHYVGGEYWLVVQPEPAPADGVYDLEVSLCGDDPFSTFASADSVEFGDLTINHMIVLDRSGSMQYPDTGESKLSAAKNAASLYVDAVGSEERVGFVWFNGDETSCTDDATTAVDLGLATGGKRTAIKNALAPLSPSGWTSIGDGMWDAQDEFDGFGALTDNRDVMVLLSDGEENETRFWDLSLSCGAGSDEGDAMRDRIVDTDTYVTAIAFGPEANQDLMQEIADTTDGDYTYVDVTIGGGGFAPSDELANSLADGYMLALQQARGLERLAFASGAAAGSQKTSVGLEILDTDVEDAVFFVNWPTGAAAPTVTLRDPQGVEVTGADAEIMQEATHYVAHMDDSISGGDWTVELTVAGASDVPYIVGVLGRPTSGVRLMTEVSQIGTGGALALPDFFGNFEQGVPVQLLAILHDENGPVTDAIVAATVTRPDDTVGCGPTVLLDDGAHNDGAADDGVYGAVFRDTQIAGTLFGAANDDPLNPNPGGVRGTYLVAYEASIAPPAPNAFRRLDRAAFQVAISNTSQDDIDLDLLPDPWEVFYGTNPFVNDASLDPDNDELTHLQEFENGGHPFDPDTDNGGEADGSEVAHGRCLNDPADDALPMPAGPVVLGTAHCLDYSELILPNSNRLHFPLHPEYQSLRIFRDSPGNSGQLSLIATLSGPELEQRFYYDTGLTPLFEYRYQLEAVGVGGAISARSRIFTGVPRPNPVQFLGSVSINHDAAQTDRTSVLAVLDPPPTADTYRLSNTPIDGTEPLVALPLNDLVIADLGATTGPRYHTLWVQYVDSTQNLESGVCSDVILFDPDGDFDNDGRPNAVDDDDDEDGLFDVDEMFQIFTDAYQRDTDGDTLSDFAEVRGGCTDPLNPDTDNDGLLDHVDLSPASDLNGDYRVDLLDFAIFQLCVSEGVSRVCACLDVNGDDLITADDYAAFYDGWTGP